ncbi:MAG: hypothetical protein KUG77_08110 [Nannocystaceae bacterium]|nr:hypothetical protein [Nannocystaceae bacterium]
MARHVLLDTELVLLRWDPHHSAVIMTRTEAELPRGLDALRAFFKSLVTALAPICRPSNDFVIDSRASMGRNDDAFETVKREFEHELFGGFKNVSVVLQSEVGRLQVQRYNDELRAQEMQVFPTVDEALKRPPSS